jgi:hypothetical protein
MKIEINIFDQNQNGESMEGYFDILPRIGDTIMINKKSLKTVLHATVTQVTFIENDDGKFIPNITVDHSP